MSAHTVINLASHVSRHAFNRPQSSSIRWGETILDYQTLEARVRSVASGLRSLGLTSGDVLAVQLPNSLEFVVALLAANRIGVVTQTVHMPYRRAELAGLLAHSRAQAFIGVSQFKDFSPAQTVLDLRSDPVHGLDRMRHVIAVGDPRAGAIHWATLAASAPDTAPGASDIDAPFVLLYTSGTTTSPKGILTPARRFIKNASQAVTELGLAQQDVILSAAPFTHLYGLFALQCALIAGASISLLPAFSPADLTATVQRDKPTHIFAGPAHFKPLLDQELMQPADYSSTRVLCLSGTTVPLALAKAVEARLPKGVVIQLWGMSELQAGSYARPGDPAEIRLETAGRAAPEIQLQVVDDSNRPLAPGLEGRLRVKGPSVFEAYLDNPAESNASLVDGWFDTGDTAILRADGGLVITGRVKELINRGGIKFNPVDVETILDAVAGVARCILAPMPDPVLGERTCAFVLRNGKSPVTLDRLLEALQSAGIAKFKWPERLEFVDDFPITPTQKVRRSALTASLTARSATGAPS
jgi:cyclohexanecarboxylate-CoA ligase